jgi:hypothetical protein
MRLLLLLNSAILALAASSDPKYTSRPLPLQQRRQLIQRPFSQIIHSWRGGSSSNRSRVSINPDEKLPNNIAGASLAAFRAPVSIPTTNVDSDDYTDIDDEEEHDELADNEETALTSSEEPFTIPPSAISQKMASLQERTVPAVLMLVGIGLWSHFLREDGLIFLTLALQAGMYQEVTRVIGGEFSHGFYKWWWFATASVAINAPRMLPWAGKEIMAVSYGMTTLGIVTTILGFNWRKAQAEEFREYLRQSAVSFLAVVSTCTF